MAIYLKINGKVCLDTLRSMFCSFLLPPYHLVDDAYVALNDLHHLSTYVFIHIVGDRDAVVTVFAEFNRGIYCLQEALGVDAGNDEVAFVNGFGAFCTGADADGRERMTYTGEEAAFFGKRAAVADYGEGIHLKAVVVVKAERFMLDYALVELEATGSKAVAAARMTAIENRHIVLLCHLVDGGEKGEEVILCVDILFSVC